MLVALCITSQANRLLVRQAGVPVLDAGVVELKDGFEVCGADFARGFTVVCDASESSAASANFFVDGVLQRVENVAPYTIAGDVDGNATAWSPPDTNSNVAIECVTSDAQGSILMRIAAIGIFGCTTEDLTSTTSTTYTTVDTGGDLGVAQERSISDGVQIVVMEANFVNARRSAPLSKGFEFCVRDFSEAISLECEAPGASKAVFVVNGVHVRQESVAPFTVSGDNGGVAAAWVPPVGQVSLGCETDAGNVLINGRFACEDDPPPSPSPSPAARVGVNASFCVGIPAASHTNQASSDWVTVDGGLVFRPDDPSTSTVGPNTAKLVYQFSVPVASTYGVTMDSLTPHGTEHNDVWLTFDSFTLRGKNEDGTLSIKPGLKQPLKAYQNDAARKKVAFSVDFNPHSFSSTEVLVPGRNYTITVGARSTKFTLFGLILFPCVQEQCASGTQHWQNYLHVCHV